MVKKGLGRGLKTILGEEAVSAAVEKRHRSGRAGAESGGQKSASGPDGNVSRETTMIRLSMIEPNPGQPRRSFDEESLGELAESIREHGVIQPIIVRKNGKTYTIVVGERRWRAARMAGLNEIPVLIRDYDSRETAEIALIENIQREDLNSVEEARAYRSLIEDFGLTQDELAKRVSKNRSTITNSLRLLQFDEDILALIEAGELSAGHARAILGISGKRAQYKAAREVINEGLSVRETEKLVKRYNSIKPEKKTPAADDDREIYIRALAEELTERMRLKVSIRQRGKKTGTVEISYNSDDELEQIIDAMQPRTT